jgi:hypothetical protein
VAYNEQSSEGNYMKAQFSSSRLEHWEGSCSLLLEDGYSSFLICLIRGDWKSRLPWASQETCSSPNTEIKGKRGEDRRKNGRKKENDGVCKHISDLQLETRRVTNAQFTCSGHNYVRHESNEVEGGILRASVTVTNWRGSHGETKLTLRHPQSELSSH